MSTPDPSKEKITISNEYAQVVIKKIRTRNGERVEITAPKLGSSIQVDAVELESLTWQDHDVFEEFLQTPFGFIPESEGSK